MSAIIYFDEDSQKKELIRLTRAAGIVCTCPNEQHTCGWHDEEQLIYAASKGWVLFSHIGGDFRSIHAARQLDRRAHAGIIVAEQEGTSFRQKAVNLVAFLQRRDADQLRNRVWDL